MTTDTTTEALKKALEREKQDHRTAIARHGGKMRALLSERDALAARVERLEAENADLHEGLTVTYLMGVKSGREEAQEKATLETPKEPKP